LRLIRRFGIALGAVALVALGATGIGAHPALAYGNAHGAHQVYQIEASSNCNNPDVCGEMLGGFWAWGVLYADGTGDAELTFCGHFANDHGPQLEGAGHMHIDLHWTIENGMIVVTSETDTIVGRFPEVDVIASEDEPIAPAAAGHYDTQDLLGFSAPGVSFQVQVVALH
jgi:hypothetical protein